MKLIDCGMIHELPKNKYHRVRTLFTELATYHLFPLAIIEGTAGGRIFTDDVDHPQRAFILVDYGEGDIYLTGNSAHADFNHDINVLLHSIFYEERKQGHEMFTMYWHPDEWETHFDTILARLNPMRYSRRYHASPTLKCDWQSKLKTGFQVVQMDSWFFSQLGVTNMDVLKDWIQYEHRTQNTVDGIHGYCVIDQTENAAVAWCQIDYVSGTRTEIGIQTAENYRKQGWGTIVAAATVEFLVSKGFDEIGWHSWAHNIASGKTAEKVGLELVLDHPVYVGMLNQFENMMVQADYFASDAICQDTQQAYLCLENAIKMAEEHHADYVNFPDVVSGKLNLQKVYYKAAVMCVTLEKTDCVFEYLRKAIDVGFTDVDSLKTDQHFSHLHPTNMWKTLLSWFD
ncbi:GNAT family N-acetyltransferase [candidate division CSSED10-310 bacterium]|uniref:GNAT family N-acetyltransferase n=1 Tax=candidate division CSSED10-310 bacterium TaxID=2855610 RepID=A0ABV6YVQ4_UNCC1